MIYHVLPGDAQVNEFRETGLQGEMLVCREALIDGDVSGDTLDEFFNNRAVFHEEDPTSYEANVASQFRRLLDAGLSDEVNLWFEYELFCAVNMWFVLSLLKDSGANVLRVGPSHLSFEDRWNGFGNTNAEILKKCFDDRAKLTESDMELGTGLWDAFRRKDVGELLDLTSNTRTAFPYIDEIGRAVADLDSKPAEIVAEIKRDGHSGLKEIFTEFRKRAGVFGFGDVQVKRLM